MSALISPKECPDKVQKCFEFKIRTSQIYRTHTLCPLCICFPRYNCGLKIDLGTIALTQDVPCRAKFLKKGFLLNKQTKVQM